MSLINQQPLDYGTFYGSGPGSRLSIPELTNFTSPITLSFTNKPTSFAQKSGSNIQILKDGKYQIFLKFYFKHTTTLGNAGTNYVTIQLKNNSSILKELSYYRVNATQIDSINDFDQELKFIPTDNVGITEFETAASGSFLSFSTSTTVFAVNSIFSTNLFSNFQTGDLISLTFLQRHPSSTNTAWVVNPEIMIKEVKY